MGEERRTHNIDVLVCHKGTWGMLEVDGEPYHRLAAKDHKRDRLFKQGGLWLIERFPADECYENARIVVGEFMRILEAVSR